MTNIYKKNNHFHIFTGEIWDLDSMQDSMRDVIAPYSVSTGKCNIVLDLSQLSERHIYNKPFVISVKRFIDNIYGVNMSIIVIPDKEKSIYAQNILKRLIETSTFKSANWAIVNSYQESVIKINTEG